MIVLKLHKIKCKSFKCNTSEIFSNDEVKTYSLCTCRLFSFSKFYPYYIDYLTYTNFICKTKKLVCKLSKKSSCNGYIFNFKNHLNMEFKEHFIGNSFHDFCHLFSEYVYKVYKNHQKNSLRI